MIVFTSLFKLLNSSKSFKFCFKRTITKEIKLHKESKHYKRKVTSIRRTIPVTKDSISTIEWKTAESVMKQLNWENKMLFGPLLNSPSTKRYSDRKFEESNEIIQHETLVPVFDPPMEERNLLNPKSEIIVDKNSSLNLWGLLTFPLVNKSLDPKVDLNSKISEWNCLRKNLEELAGQSFIPSVSAILEKTIPIKRKEILERWKQKMILQLGEEGFEKYKKELFDNGKSLHDSINNYLTQTPESEMLINEANQGHWKSLKQIFPNVSDVKLLEEFVEHPFLRYRGVVDCFAKYKNQLVVIDWKTSKKSKINIKSTYDNPLQIAAYVGALNFDPKYQYLASKGLIVVAYENEAPATVHYLDETLMLDYWNEWLKRVKEYWEIKCAEVVNS